MPIYAFEDHEPRIDPSASVRPDAVDFGVGEYLSISDRYRRGPRRLDRPEGPRHG